MVESSARKKAGCSVGMMVAQTVVSSAQKKAGCSVVMRETQTVLMNQTA